MFSHSVRMEVDPRYLTVAELQFIYYSHIIRIHWDHWLSI